MKLTDFDYLLPEERIAQEPAAQRDGSRLLVLARNGGSISHRAFRDFADLMRPKDLLVLNDTRVIPARLRGRKKTGGQVEILLDRPLGPARQEAHRFTQDWAFLAQAAKPLKEGSVVEIPAGGRMVVGDRLVDGGGYRGKLELPEPLDSYLVVHGEVPLPAYIRRGDGSGRAGMDRERYQTVFARENGAVAAPTAGLHFTSGMLDQLRARGVQVVFVTLHVGPGTFLPVRVEDIERHVMHPERYRVDQAAADAITAAKAAGERVVAVGTTVVRTLEAAFDNGAVHAGEGMTNLFIRPGYKFRVVDALLTNFHLPKSTLLMLVCAFADTKRILAAYREAVEKGYRFYSYGDAMLLV